MPVRAHDADVNEILRRLLHDIRSPLSVAHGYVRLLRDGRLTSGPDRDKAFDATLLALERMGELCQYADACVEAPPAIRPSLVPAHQVSERIAGALGTSTPEARGLVAVGHSLDRLVDALVRVIQSGTAAVIADAGTLQVTGRRAVDHRMLHYLAACRTIDTTGARLVHEGEDVSVVFSLEPES